MNKQRFEDYVIGFDEWGFEPSTPSSAPDKVIEQYQGMLKEVLKDYNELEKYRELKKQIACPLKVRCEVVPNSYIYTFGTSMENIDIVTRRKVITIDKEGFTISYATATGRQREMTLPWSAYKKTWWLKEDRRE